MPSIIRKLRTIIRHPDADMPAECNTNECGLCQAMAENRRGRLEKPRREADRRVISPRAKKTFLAAATSMKNDQGDAADARLLSHGAGPEGATGAAWKTLVDRSCGESMRGAGRGIWRCLPLSHLRLISHMYNWGCRWSTLGPVACGAVVRMVPHVGRRKEGLRYLAKASIFGAPALAAGLIAHWPQHGEGKKEEERGEKKRKQC